METSGVLKTCFSRLIFLLADCRFWAADGSWLNMASHFSGVVRGSDRKKCVVHRALGLGKWTLRFQVLAWCNTKVSLFLAWFTPPLGLPGAPVLSPPEAVFLGEARAAVLQ